MSFESGQLVNHRWLYGDRKHAVDALFSPEDADMYQIKFGLSSGYLRSTIKPQYYSHHAIAKRMGLIWDGVKVIIDHINRDRFDNRRENLRVVNRSENALNSYSQDNAKGYYYSKGYDGKNKWVACIERKGKKKVKYCYTESEAIAARKEMLNHE
jgi:hypothetical protein